MIYGIILLAICSSLYIGVVQAQDNTSPNDQDSSSEQAEQAEAREDAYRKRMELEGSRDQDTFSNTTYTAQTKQEKIDKLPKESRDNIRDQLTDVIIENGQWEPFDALKDYPYEPSETAQEDPGLREQEEEAWAEQMEKYHQREANAFGASRPSMPGSDSRQAGASPSPGGQPGKEQNQQGEGEASGGESQGEEGQQGESQAGEGESQGEEGQEGSQGSSSSSASSYDPYQPQQNDDDADEISTAGVSESALDFLRARQEQGSGSAGQAASAEDAMEQQEAFSQARGGAENGTGNEAATAQQSSQDSQQQSEPEIIIPGTIAIEDLDKLEGMAEPEDDSEKL